MKIYSILLSVFLLGAFGVQAQIRPDVVIEKKGGKSSIDLSRFQAQGLGGTTLVSVLRSDLTKSGFFAQGLPGRSEYTILGSASDAGGQITARVQVAKLGNPRAVFSKAYRGPSSDARRLAHQMADDILGQLKGIKGMASSRIALVGNKSGSKELYICDSDGRGLRQITRFGSTVMTPRWGPRAQKLTFTAWLRHFPDVYMVDTTKASRPQPVATYPGMNSGGVISPNGQEIALILSRDGKPELYVKNLRSGKLLRITFSGMSPKASPTWSPNGSQIAYVSGHAGNPHIYIVDKKVGAKPRRLTTRNKENVSPSWGKNGWIAYAGTSGGGNYHIAIINPKTGENRVISPSGANYEDPSWAPNGRHLVCSRSQQYRSSVYILDTQGDAPIALVSGNGDWYSPNWSP